MSVKKNEDSAIQEERNAPLKEIELSFQDKNAVYETQGIWKNMVENGREGRIHSD